MKGDFLSDIPHGRRAAELISGLFDERLTLDEQTELESVLLSDSRFCELYVHLAHLHAGLYKYAPALGDISDEDLEPPRSADAGLMNETMVLPALNHAGVASESLYRDEELFSPAPYTPPADPPKQYGWPHFVGIAALVMIALCAAVYILIRPIALPTEATAARTFGQRAAEPENAVPLASPIATLWLTSKAVWNQMSPPADGKFGSSQSLMLSSGAVQLHLQNGGRLVVEGPADLHFLTPTQFVLNRGKLVAFVPGGGLIIQCPKGSVKDLGTEFGLEVQVDGSTEVAVFNGKVGASLSSTATTQADSSALLSAGQAAIISDKAIARSPGGAVRQRYVCNLANASIQSLDVTDLISGGDGTTQKRGIAIDSVNGNIGNLKPCGTRNGDDHYHPISGYPVLDGTFIPDGAIDQMVVDSAGDSFKFITSWNQTHNLIETGGPIPWDDISKISTVLSGVDYSKPGHGVVCMHSNNGLTLDLDAIRRLYPGRQISSFRCLVGNSYVNGWQGAKKMNPVAGIFLLVDGNPRFQKAHLSNHDGAIPVEVTLGANDRFLTLATTDANTDIDQQWILWVDARFDLAKSTK